MPAPDWGPLVGYAVGIGGGLFTFLQWWNKRKPEARKANAEAFAIEASARAVDATSDRTTLGGALDVIKESLESAQRSGRRIEVLEERADRQSVEIKSLAAHAAECDRDRDRLIAELARITGAAPA